MDIPLTDRHPGLLVSVRVPTEVDAAIAGGADWIDIKEPNRGALGPPDRGVVSQVIRCVAKRAPISAAAGELLSNNCNKNVRELTCHSLAAIKIGLVGCAGVPNWRWRWKHAIAQIQSDVAVVAVAYADWSQCHAPAPELVLDAAVDVGSPALLIDTYKKIGGNLFDYLPISHLQRIIIRAGEAGIAVALAGSLQGTAFTRAVLLRPHLIAVRAAACGGIRHGSVSRKHVMQLSNQIRQLCDFRTGSPAVVGATRAT